MDNLLKVITREGVLIHTSVRFWRGCKKLKAQDIGLNPDEVSDRLVSLGQKRLLPKEALAPLTLLEGRVQALIENNTFPFLNGLAHFLPNSRLQEVTDKLENFRREFESAQGEFLRCYSRHRKDAQKEWQTMAQKLSSNRLVNFIDQFKQMNFVGDAEMEQRLQQVRLELLSRTAEEYRDNRTAQERLRTGLADLASHARELTKTDTTALVQRFGELGKRRLDIAA